MEFSSLNSTCQVRMASLDVTSLFTNVPSEDVLNFIERKIIADQIILPIPRDVFMSLLRLCIEGNVFEFSGRYYRQHFGVSMGSPLSPVLAGLFMEYFETELLPTIHPSPALWLRYVDDVFLLWQVEENFEAMFSQVNRLSASIQFTTEWEQDGKLSFLDVNVHRLPSGFSFSIFRKPKHSGQYLHYYSCHTEEMKKSTLFSTFLRAYRLSDQIYLDEETKYIFDAFSKLGYPNQVMMEVHRKVRQKFYTSPVERVPPRTCPTVRLPLNDFTTNYAKPALRANNIRVVHPSVNSIGSKLVKRRPQLPTSRNERAGVYVIPCKDCDDRYIGQTGKKLSVRLGQHKDACRLGHKNNSVYKHVRDKNHAIDWGSSKMVYNSNDYYRRLVVESSLIKRVPNFNSMQSTLLIDDGTSELILKSKPKILRDVG